MSSKPAQSTKPRVRQVAFTKQEHKCKHQRGNARKDDGGPKPDALHDVVKVVEVEDEQVPEGAHVPQARPVPPLGPHLVVHPHAERGQHAKHHGALRGEVQEGRGRYR